jgi:hypothetical protein
VETEGHQAIKTNITCDPSVKPLKTTPDLCAIAEVVSEMSKYRRTRFDVHRTGLHFPHAYDSPDQR